MGGYSNINCITLTNYESRTFNNNDIVIYDLKLALNDDRSTINNNIVWSNIGLNTSANIPSLIIYADDEILSASWENIILKKDDFPNFPNFSSLVFDGSDEGRQFYEKVISIKITGFESLSKILLDCVQEIISLDISDNGLTVVDFDGTFDRIRSMTIRNINPNSITISGETLEYLDMTDTTVTALSLSSRALKTLIGFTPNTLVADEQNGDLPTLLLTELKIPINLSNFPSDISILLYYDDYFPIGLETIETITSLTIRNCKNINKIRDLYINDCKEIDFMNIYKLNKIKINQISEYSENSENKNSITMIANIDLVSLELPHQDFTDIKVILYANINLSEIICDGISYCKEDDVNDLVALCEVLKINLYKISDYDNDAQEEIKHRLGFNKLYIKEDDYYNINPQIYKNSKLLGTPLTGDDIADILKYSNVMYSYIEFPDSISGIIDNSGLTNMLSNNVVNYNGNSVNISRCEVYKAFVALGLNEYTAESFVTYLDKFSYGAIVFTDKPNLLKGVKNHKVINPFNYAPDLPNIFGIKLVVY